jgi:deoxycytidylate deaminase
VSESSTTFISGPQLTQPEIFIGLVGALGTDLSRVEQALTQALAGVSYRASPIHVSDLIHDVAAGRTGRADTDIDVRMDEGDALREAINHGGAAAALAIAKISDERDAWLAENDSPTGERTAYAAIIRQLKHPEEVVLLRSVYGPRFVLVGAWSPRTEREKAVLARLQRDHPGEVAGWYASNQTRLLERDEKDATNKLGQRVRDTFELADAYVALLPGREIEPECNRLIRLLFGSPFETPTPEEQAMFTAWGARLRSSASGRQVGAVVVDPAGEILVTGVNEVPKAGGGQYWPRDVPDNRDFQYGYDINDRQKRELVTEVFQLLAKARGWLKAEREDSNASELTREALEGPLAGSRIADILEFGRIAHAEMAAICTAARRGTALGGMTMYTTTYPCHECARLIVATGLMRVVYIDPYPKSQVPMMFRHEVAEGPSDCPGMVVFEPFRGVAPRLYGLVFTMSNRGRERDPVTGEYKPWERLNASPRMVGEREGLMPLQTMEDPVSLGLRQALAEAGWLDGPDGPDDEPPADS